jgi:hypothetical protein
MVRHTQTLRFAGSFFCPCRGGPNRLGKPGIARSLHVRLTLLPYFQHYLHRGHSCSRAALLTNRAGTTRRTIHPKHGQGVTG